MSLRSIAPSAARFLAIAALLLACDDKATRPADNPTPGITAITPASVEQGREELLLTVTGSDFVRSSVVRINGGDRPTEYVSETELEATLPQADFASAGHLQIVVSNPAPGGGASNVMLLAIGAATAPHPAMISLSPEFVAAGSAGAIITVTGSGFTSTSRIVVGTSVRAVTFISPTQIRFPLTEADLAAGGILSLRVLNIAGEQSNNLLLEVRSPLPAITSLSETQTVAGQEGVVIQVNGSNFTAGSEVRFNGAPRATQRIGTGTLEATLLEGDLRAAGTFSITVSNPAPGGGTSNALSFAVVNGVPELTLLPSQGATAGRSGFTLHVHGRRFVPGSVIHWNGTPRATQYISGTRVAATVSSADVAQPGVVQITVVNPTPGGGTSSAATMTIRPLGAATATSSQVPIQARDLAYERTTGRIYVSVIGSAQPNGNSIVAIDPLSGAITGSTFVGSEPGKLALSDDGHWLYVGLNGASGVRRVELPSLTPGLQWSVGAGLVAGDMEVMPGMPGTVAVSRHSPGLSPPLAGVTIYDDGLARPTSSPSHTGGARIAFLDLQSILYGYNNAHTGFEFFRIGIDASGARHLTVNGGLISGFYTDIVGASGRIYGTDGSVVDAEARVRIGSFAGGAMAMAVDPALGRAYLLFDSQIRAYDLNTFQHLASVAVPAGSFDHPALVSTRLVRWGTDGLAFLDQTKLFIVRSPIFAP